MLTGARQRLMGGCAGSLELLRAFGRNKDGNVIITAAVALPVIVGAMGVAVSYSTGASTRTKMQTALDSAVLAAAVLPDTVQASERILTAQNVFNDNLSSFARSSTQGIVATFSVNGDTVTGEASGAVVNVFGSLIGADTYQAKVAAAAKRQETPICVLGLNGLENGSFDINGGPIFNADCAVQANSNASGGMSQEGKSATVKAKKFNVSGGHKTETYDPPPTDGVTKVADPYASMPFPAHAVCDKNANMLDIKDDTTLSPGTYCGGIHINGSGPVVTLEPGIYVMADGPFWVNGGAVVAGDKVMIAFTGKGAALQVWGDASVKLTSPTSGTYMNMQFMQDRDDPNSRGLWGSIGGNSGGKDSNAKLQYDGVAYFPTQNFWVFGNAVLNANSPTLAIVADKIWTQGNATVNITHANPRNLTVARAPQTTSGVRLLK